MDKQMKPRVKDYTFFTETKDGVFFKAWSEEFVLKGKSLAAWIRQIFPHLDGSKTIAELIAPLSEPYAVFVTNLIQELTRKGVIEDSRGCPDSLSADEYAPYKHTILLLKEKASDWQTRFAKVRDTRLLVLGGGSVRASFVRALLRMGISSFALVDPLDGELRQIIADWSSSGPAPTVIQVPLAQVDALLETGAERPNLVVAVRANHDDAAWQHVLQVVKDSDVAVLQAALIEGVGVVGPIEHRTAEKTWSDLLERLHVPNGTRDVEAEPLFLRMLGNLLAVVAFRYRSGLLSDAHDVTLLDAETWQISNHRLWPAPDSPDTQRSVADSLALFRSQQTEIAQADFLQSLEIYVDEKMGLLASLHPEGLPQLPVLHMKANVCLPKRYGTERLQGVGAGTTLEEASEAAVRQAFLAYAEHLEQEQAAERERTAAVVAWSSGRSYPEWYGNGLLQGCMQLVQERMLPFAIKRLSMEACDAERPLTMFQVLKTHFRVDVQIWAVETDVSGFRMVLLSTDGKMRLAAVGKTQSEAVDALLLQAVSALELGLDLPELELLEPADSLDQNAEPAKWVNAADEDTDWTSWSRQVTTQLQARGMTVEEWPWTRDRNLYDLGLLVGRMTIWLGDDAQ